MKAKNLLILFSAVFLAACVSNDLPPVTIQGSLGQDVTVREHQTIVFNLDPDLPIEVLTIEESRCPINALCVSAGSAKVTFRINPTAETFDLSIPRPQPQQNIFDSHTFEFSAISYRLVLKDVTPTPSLDNKKTVKSAVFQLEKI